MPGRTVADNVSTRLRRHLADRGLTQDAFAAEIGRSQSTISRWIKGDFTWPASDLLAVARTLGVDVAELYAGVEPASSSAPSGTEAVASELVWPHHYAVDRVMCGWSGQRARSATCPAGCGVEPVEVTPLLPKDLGPAESERAS